MSNRNDAGAAARLKHLVLAAIDDRKGVDPIALDVAELTDITDIMVIVSGTSSRHVKALLDRVLETVKEAGYQVLGIEGRDRYEWVLVDLADVVVHVMSAESRDFYDLERLWETPAEATEADGGVGGASVPAGPAASAGDRSAISI